VDGVVDALVAHCRGLGSGFELILIDDGSTDGTPAALAACARKHPEVRVLSNDANRGKGYSVRRGLAAAQGANVVFTDADLPYGTAAISRVVDALVGEADVAIGSRVLPESRFRMHPRHFPYIFMRHLLGRVFLKIVNLLFGLEVTDTQCGIKACRRAAAHHIAERLTMDRFIFDVELLHVARRAGFRITEVPVELKYEGHMTAVRVLRNAVSVPRDLLRMKLADWRGQYVPGGTDVSCTGPIDRRASYYYDSYHERASLRHVFHKRRVDHLARLVPGPGRVLDVGCGSGILCRLLADRGCEVTGLDIGPERVAWCRQLVPEGSFHAGDVRTFQLGARYSVVVCSEVLEHFGAADRRRALRNLVEHLETGGTLILTVPAALYIRLEPAWRIVRAWKYGAEDHDDEHHEVVSPAALEADLRAAGCEPVRRGNACWGLIRWWLARRP
jgi:glycosyltransferase involved in cell wall biosynthesis